MSEHLALLQTDLVDSTRLNEEVGDEIMGKLWEAHDRAARTLLGKWRGREVDKTDGLFALFESVGDAVEYAFDYHRALASIDPRLKARAGAHVGDVECRTNSPEDVAAGVKPIDVSGIAVPIVARLMSMASGGQTLLSAQAETELGRTSHRIKCHGYWRIKGLEGPFEVFEVGDEGMPFLPPADTAKCYRVSRQQDLWVPVRELRHSLKAERDQFVGRQAALGSLRRSFDEGARLVSILGIGGSGKTRLAQRYGRIWLGEFSGGAWFCDLSQARDLDAIVRGVAQGLELPLASADPIEQIGTAIAGRGPCLVMLDNFEQVSRYAEETVGHWLDRAPLAQFIVTTREVLGIAGEAVLHLSPLSANEGEELFAQRAATARIGHELEPKDTEAIRQLVRVLDGLPLAIELAAARVRVMTPRTLLARMRDRLNLIGAQSGRVDRQATLRATFDWSWDLLVDGERSALAALSVFEGGFTLDSAAAVVMASGDPAEHAVGVVQSLVDKSFVRQVADDRFDLLETVRQYATTQLMTEGRFPGSGRSCLADARARHFKYFAGLDEHAAVAHRCVETSNLVAACRAAIEAGDFASATDCLVVAWSALRLTGPYRVAVDLAQRAGALQNLDSRERALVYWVAGDALELLGEVEAARTSLRRGLECADEAQAPDCRARLLITIGNRQTLDGEMDAARRSLEDAYRLASDLGRADLQMRALNTLGLHSDHQSRWKEAQTFYQRALALARTLGDRRMEGGLLGNLGGLYYDEGDSEAARIHYDMALTLANELGDIRWEGNARCNLGLLHQDKGNVIEAREHFDIALTLARQVGHARLEYTVLCNLGILLAAKDKHDEAALHFEQAVAAAASCSDVRAEGQFKGYLAVSQARRGHIDQARESLESGGRVLRAMADDLSYALLLCDRAEVEVIDGNMRAAADALAYAERVASDLHCLSDSDLRRRIAMLRNRVDPSCYSDAAVRG